jgi:hypothetical protein
VAKEAGHLPVLCLHGGPGLGFKYMEACEVLVGVDTTSVISQSKHGYTVQLMTAGMVHVTVTIVTRDTPRE